MYLDDQENFSGFSLEYLNKQFWKGYLISKILNPPKVKKLKIRVMRKPDLPGSE
jgi:hypothetical protein